MPNKRGVDRYDGDRRVRTLLDLRGKIPSFIRVSDGKMHDVNAFFVTRAKSNVDLFGPPPTTICELCYRYFPSPCSRKSL
ncbi:hypothetical protein [Marinobacter salarius]|uniref:hypothetical protein n=1 Tax=Marinobacter salarius TaxID=1420917 RepID=UPI0032ECFB3E